MNRLRRAASKGREEQWSEISNWTKERLSPPPLTRNLPLLDCVLEGFWFCFRKCRCLLPKMYTGPRSALVGLVLCLYVCMFQVKGWFINIDQKYLRSFEYLRNISLPRVYPADLFSVRNVISLCFYIKYWFLVSFHRDQTERILELQGTIEIILVKLQVAVN